MAALSAPDFAVLLNLSESDLRAMLADQLPISDRLYREVYCVGDREICKLEGIDPDA